ncbi:RidA family protein [Formosa undariae]|uniref:RidA family protein n=1 Tax=Formosa undariae TaxID=1325436 RepID=A0ABV5F3H2_9FLAO
MQTPTHQAMRIMLALALIVSVLNCDQQQKETPQPIEKEVVKAHETPEYFLLRPEVEKAYGYAHAVKTGNAIKISGAASMDDTGQPTAIGDFGQQMKNCYANLDKILKHYGCTFDNVIVENVFTTHMALFLEHAAFRSTIYTKHFPTGS